MLSTLSKLANGLTRMASVARKASVYGSLDPKRILRYNVNSFLYRNVFKRFTWRSK